MLMPNQHCVLLLPTINTSTPPGGKPHIPSTMIIKLYQLDEKKKHLSCKYPVNIHMLEICWTECGLYLLAPMLLQKKYTIKM